MAQQVKKAFCWMCHAQCRVLVHSDNGRLIKIEEDRSDPRVDLIWPPTRACMRLLRAKEWFYHPERISFPLKRAGEKGEGKWDRISWDQAFDEIAERLNQIKEKNGAEAIAVTRGTGRTHLEYMARFCYLLGTPNITGAANICFAPCTAVANAMYGWSVRHRTTKTIDTGGAQPVTRCVMVIGMDPSQSTPRLWKSMRDSKKVGAKVIVVDPRRTETTELADLWLQLRPGTDTALLMSMINVIIEEGLYDRDFVEKWCYGFDRLAERAKNYRPEKAAKITWVSTDKIIEAARMFAENKPALAIHGMGMEHLQNSIEAIQARFILTAITGNVDVAGGDYLPGPAKLIPPAEIELGSMLSPEQKRKQLGADRFKLLSWPGRDQMQEYTKRVWGTECGTGNHTALAHAPTMFRAILTGKPYPVKAVITVASNPILTGANAKLVYKALQSLELYVVMDYWLTPCAEIADYVLPVASWLERPHLADVGGQDCRIIAGEKALPSTIRDEYDHRTDYEIFREIGIRLGQEEYWPWENLEQAYDYRLQPMGISFQEFMDGGGFALPPDEYKKYKNIGFATPTGKVELYSTIFEKLGYDPLPHYEESHENPISAPKLAEEYPLMLITGGRFRPMYHSEHRNIDSIRRRRPDPLVQINPETAKRLGIQDGEWVWIKSPRGTIRMKCQYFNGIHPTVIHAEHGWWFPELPGEEPWLRGAFESNVNVLTDDNPDVCNRLAGGWPLKTGLCKVYRVKAY